MIMNCGATLKCVTGVPKAEKREKIKHICRNNGPRFSKVGKICKPTDLSNPEEIRRKLHQITSL